MTTPMMQQYQEAKERHPGMLLLFRMGDFYELFHEDAEVVSRVLGLTLTSRDKDDPHGRLSPSRPRHLSAQTAARRPSRRHLRPGRGRGPGQGAGRREVTRVVTPGTLTEDDLLDPREANYLVALSPRRHRRPRSAWPGSNCRPACSRPPTCRATRLADELARLAPAEVPVREKHWRRATAGRCWSGCAPALPGLALTPRPDWTFDADSARARAVQPFRRHHAGRLRLRRPATVPDRRRGPAALSAGNAQGQPGPPQPAAAARREPLPVPRRGDPPQPGADADPARRRAARLAAGRHRPHRDADGRRLLQDWLLAPLADRAAIEARLDAVAELVDDHALRQELRGVAERGASTCSG